jgi:hypothetical protein
MEFVGCLIFASYRLMRSLQPIHGSRSGLTSRPIQAGLALDDPKAFITGSSRLAAVIRYWRLIVYPGDCSGRQRLAEQVHHDGL